VGLDVVLKSIERLNGLVEVETVPGVGTKFIIQLPLTLAIISVLMVEVSGRTYAVPLSAVVETLRLERRRSTASTTARRCACAERIVPVLRLAALFGLRAGPSRRAPLRGDRGPGREARGDRGGRPEGPAGGGHQGPGPGGDGRAAGGGGGAPSWATAAWC
jgi:chemotaxis protein histidine kinase CheA